MTYLALIIQWDYSEYLRYLGVECKGHAIALKDVTTPRWIIRKTSNVVYYWAASAAAASFACRCSRRPCNSTSFEFHWSIWVRYCSPTACNIVRPRGTALEYLDGLVIVGHVCVIHSDAPFLLESFNLAVRFPDLRLYLLLFNLMPSSVPRADHWVIDLIESASASGATFLRKSISASGEFGPTEWWFLLVIVTNQMNEY